jgi:hypothetical protein
LLTAIVLSPAAALAASFTASLDRDTISLGETVTLTLAFEGGSPKGVPQLPSIPGLRPAGGTSHSINQRIDFGSGSFVTEDTYRFTLSPQKEGEYTIPALTAEVAGQRLTSQTLKLKVLPPTAPPPEVINSGSQLAFMRLVLPKKEIFLGETIVGELQLYFRDVVQGIGNFQLTSLPADGLTASSKFVQGQERRVQVGNTMYRVVPLGLTFTAVKTGTINVGPAAASVVVQIPSGNRRRDSIFDQFGFRDPFGEQRQVTLASETETVQSLPLPKENVPSDFNGAVGTFEMAVSAGPTNLTAGDPITVRVQIAGRGALDAVALPTQTAWHDFKSYPPTSRFEPVDQFGLQGTKTFEQIVVPQSTDVHELPAFSFSFFDPETKAYRTLTQPAVRLTVRPGGATPVPVIAAANNPRQDDSPPVQQDIVPIKQHLGTLAQVSTPLATQTWFLAAQSVPVMAFLAAFAWRRRTDSLANNPRLRRQRRVAQMVHDGLGELRQLAKQNNSDEFFATLFHLLQEQLGERIECPASSITEAVIEEKLRPREVAEPTLAALHELFQMCNLARYAPVKSSQELAALVPKVEKVLGDLRDIRT